MDRKEKIRSAAEDVFQRLGYEKASLKEVAFQAGVNPSLISYYFGGKKKLYELVMDRSAMGEEKKERLRQTALRLFAEKGYHQVSIRDIADAASVNSASISYYFGGKFNLYRTLLFEETSLLVEFIKEAGKKDLSAEEVFRLHSRLVCRMEKEHPYGLRLMFWELMAPTRALGELAAGRLSKALAVFQSAIERGQKGGVLRDDIVPAEASISWVGMMIFYFFSGEIQKRILPESVAADHYTHQACAIFLRGISKETS